MKEFKDIKDLENLPHVDNLIDVITDSLDVDTALDFIAGFSFMSIFGGNLFLIETKEDLKSVCPDLESDEGYIVPFDTYDYVTDLPASDKKLYHLLTIINNNSGGPTYIVPSELVDQDVEVLIAALLAQN
jgi:hypothetical protein